MARCSLQVISQRPVVLVAELFLDHRGQRRCHAAELLVAEGVGGTGIREEGAILVVHALGGDDHAIAPFLHGLANTGQELRTIEGDFRKQNDMWRISGLARSKSAGRGDPAGVTTHHFEDEYLGRCRAHRGNVETCLEGRDGNVFRHRTETRAGVGERQIVVDRLRDVDCLDRVSETVREL